MAYFGVDSQVRIEELNLKFRGNIRAKNGNLTSLKDIFTKFDTNGNGKLDINEFEEALSAFG
jgi:Ca2+-binding EF-hand superfamily protein